MPLTTQKFWSWVCLLEDLLGKWEGRENHGWFLPWQGQHLNNSSLQRCVSAAFCLKPKSGFEFLLLVFGQRKKNLGVSGIIFARNLGCFFIPFRAIQILCFCRERNKVQAKTCLGDGSLRESFLLASCEHLLQQHHQHTNTVQGTAWRIYLHQDVVSIPMRSCLLLDLVCTDKAVLFSCVLNSDPWVSSVPLCLLSVSDQVSDQAWKSAHQKTQTPN